MLSKGVDAMTDHRLDMTMLAIVVHEFLDSSLAFSAASSEQTTTSSSSSSVISFGKTGKTHSL